MSFGFGIGDFLAVIQLANKTRKAFVDAPVQFKSISDEVRSLSLVLQDVDIDISAKELSSQQQAELQEISTGCNEVLADILEKIEDYTELSTTNDTKRNIAKRVWKRLKWEPSDVQELRLRIGTNIALLAAFNGQMMRRGVEKLVQHQDEEVRQKVLDWISPSNYATQQSDYINRREEGTGQWFLDSVEFHNWISGSKQTLFCPGIPGAGKTILASIVIDELYDRCGNRGEDVGIAYLYCNFKRNDDQSSIEMLSSILKQLAQSQSSLPSSIRELHAEHVAKGTRPSLGEISKTIQVLSKLSDIAKVYIVIDALDECRMYDGSRTRFLDVIFELQDSCNLSLLVTSRFIPEITERFKEKPALEIRASTVDVMRYLRGNLAMLPAFVLRNSELQTEISTEITRAVDGMFLLAQLYLNSLVGKRSPKAIRSALKDISSSTKQYDSAYHDAMKRIEGQISDQTEMAMQVLTWITCAKRPLTTAELQSALAVEINESDFDEDNLPDLIDMVSVCAGLVTIDEQSNVIRLVHYTTQEFFERNQSIWFPKANCYIGSICVAYLSLDIFKTGHCQTEKELTSCLDHHPFGVYAAVFWGQHIREREADGEQYISEEAIIELLLDRPKVSSCVQFMYSVDRQLPPDEVDIRNNDYSLIATQLATAMHLVAYFELLDVIRKLISVGGSVNCVDAAGMTPLSWAAQRNHPDAIRLLLANGANPNIKDNRGTTALFFAVRFGHEQAVQLLLEANSDLVSNEIYGSLLHVSVMSGSEGVARLLLEQGLAAHAKDSSGHTPLFLAASVGDLYLVQLFIDWDRDIDTQNIELNASMTVAVRDGKEAIVRFLLDRGADPNNLHFQDMTVLMRASASANASVVRLLLDWGVDLEIKDNKGLTALSHAAMSSGTEAVIQLLLAKGADINNNDNENRGAVYYATSENRYTNLPALFTSTNIRNIHQPDLYGRTPLHVAAIRGHLQSTLTLLKSDGVDCEAQDELGRTPLSDAIMRKRSDVVKALETFSKTSSEVTFESVIEATSQTEAHVICDICGVYILTGEAFYYCTTCNGANFDICEVCYHLGARCLDFSHEMELRHGRELRHGSFERDAVYSDKAHSKDLTHRAGKRGNKLWETNADKCRAT
ncbi:hypothetical protein VN97_g257 [Penicillium thymicola]|uniref:NACHT domain-containing protein n=1 Tax=Penicillium thymicola TaxID=293382 RepID=A0AAI9XDU6_PENTH|nr:hypothetical protein VN97_g257 [Penicillium thymicola]